MLYNVQYAATVWLPAPSTNDIRAVQKLQAVVRMLTDCKPQLAPVLTSGTPLHSFPLPNNFCKGTYIYGLNWPLIRYSSSLALTHTELQCSSV